MNETTVTTPNELEIRVERVFDAPRAHLFSVWTDSEQVLEGGATVLPRATNSRRQRGGMGANVARWQAQ
jgi:uncharacterized protein YndB with AHSA1/START domain